MNKTSLPRYKYYDTLLTYQLKPKSDECWGYLELFVYFTRTDETNYFIEVVPVASDSVDLVKMDGKLKVLRCLDKRGFSIPFQEENCFCYELTIKGKDLEGECE